VLEGERQGTSATDNEPEWRQPYKKNARKPGALQEILVGAKGFEPSTPRSRTECSTRLSHAPTSVNGYSTSTSRHRDSSSSSASE
jgi:hypothetical protein